MAAIVGSYDGRDWQIRYGADAATGQLSGGNDVLLMPVSPVPEPSTFLLLVLAAVAGGLHWHFVRRT